MMSDEIDIEEHDVLDNPTLRGIFPDLSVVKKEILQYEEELASTAEVSVREADIGTTQTEKSTVQQCMDLESDEPSFSKSQDTTQKADVNNSLEVHLRFKAFLDSLSDDLTENTDITNTQSSTFGQNLIKDNVASSRLSRLKTFRTPGKVVKNLQNNIFILGSKPSVSPSKNALKGKKQPKLVLKNVTPYLNRCKRFCKNCLILFPNIYAFTCHLDKIHSLQSDQYLAKEKKQSSYSTSQVKFKCEICELSLSSKGNLVRHFKRFHDKSNAIHETRRSLKENNKIIKPRILKEDTKSNESKTKLKSQTKSKITKSHECFHCSKIFGTRSSLIEHLYEVLNPKLSVSPSSAKNGKITKSQDTAPGRNKDAVILITSKVIECKICTMKFSSQRQLDLHNKRSHNSKIENRSKFTKDVKRKTNLGKIIDSCINSRFKKHSIEDKYKESESQRHNESNNDIESENDVTADSVSDYTKIRNKDNSRNNVQKKQVYQCFVCSRYIKYFKSYFRHMRDHNINRVYSEDKSVFEPHCKFCPAEEPNMQSYNKHLSKCHEDKLIKHVQLDDKAFHSVLFKCVQCDVFFLSTNAAKNHSEHREMLVNWQCVECSRLFKLRDKPQHLKQHSLSKNILSYSLSASALDRVLYKCLKCAIHFSEIEYYDHYITCGVEIPNSTYCNVCDILINSNDLVSHESEHKDKGLQPCDFTFVETDVIGKSKTDKKMSIKLRHPIPSYKFALTFCQNCNCFIGKVAKGRKSHVDGKCSIWLKGSSRICRKCGLVFTPRGYISHKMLHDQVKTLNFNDFYFYDIRSKQPVQPPIPQYPQCDICEIHFFNKPDIKVHECSQQQYITCSFCKTKFTEAAYKVHKNFHTYKLLPSDLKKQKGRLKLEEALTSSTPSNQYNTDKCSSEEKELVNINNTPSETTNAQEAKFLYTCISCDIRLDMYDNVVRHCHDHYDYCKEIKTGDHKARYDNHNAVSIKFDPFYFRFDNAIWIKHIFANFTQEQIDNILENSIYKYECRLKFEELHPGSLTLYKCGICRSYVDPNELVLHASDACAITKNYPCSLCRLCFSSSEYQMLHEKLHNCLGANTKSYKIILYNKTDHLLFTKIMIDACNKFILYQCRNCNGVVDKFQRGSHQCLKAEYKKCSHCGLLFYKQFDSHMKKHEEIINYKPENMILVLFGKFESERDSEVMPTFAGTIHDLTFHKCTSCGLCLKSESDIPNHVCVSKVSKSQCPKCYLCFLKNDLEDHSELHENNLELGYDDFNSNIIPFDITVKENSNVNKSEHDQNTNDIELQNNENPNPMRQLYRCNCGLHFLKELNARNHSIICNPRMKVSKQRCVKCNLLFTPGELFEHLLQHHADKKIKYQFDILNI